MVGDAADKARLIALLEEMGKIVVNAAQPLPQYRDPFERFFMMLEGIDKTDNITEYDTLEDLMAGERTWWIGL